MWSVVGLSLFAISIIFTSNFLHNIFGFLSLSGIFISIATFKTELGIQSKTIKQVCGIVGKGGCSQVLKSKFAKGIFGITPADMSVIYFVAQYLLYISSVLYPIFFTILPYIAITGVILIGLSIYTQYFVLKQWCALCLGIVSILFLQASISFFIVNNISIQSIIAFMLLSLLGLIILLPIKSLLKTVINSKPKIAEFKKWKQDADLFITQLNTQEKVDTNIWKNDLVIGNPNAPILITVACNPYCSPCAKAHVYLDEILSKHANYIKIQIRLLFVPNDETDKLTIAVTEILQQAVTLKCNKQLQESLTDWFTWMNFEKWNNKWKVNSKINVEESLANHSSWMQANNITHTPTFFINGKLLPSKYNLEDFEKILPQLVETI